MENMNKIKIIDLKSPILKIIFSFINQKKKLNIIINNKNEKHSVEKWGEIEIHRFDIIEGYKESI